MSINGTIEKPQAPARTIGERTMLSMFLRSLLIQAGWNYQRSQNIGFAFSLLPALRKIYAPPGRLVGQAAPEALKAAVLRHLEMFNTQPYMAGFVIGNIAGMEEALASFDSAQDKLRPGSGQAAGGGGEAQEKNVRDIKQALASSYASIGDRIFWGRLKPMTTQLCIAVWLLAGFYGWLFTEAGSDTSELVLLAGPLLGMAVYGTFALSLRWIGLKKGYACGGGSNCGLDALDWTKLIRRLSLAGFALSLTIALAALALLIEFNRGVPARDLALKLGLVLSVLALHRIVRRFGRSIFFAIGVILAVSVTFFGIMKLGKFGLL